MSNYDATTWERAMDQNYRPCWVNKQGGQATYQLLDSNGFPLQQNYGGGYGGGWGGAGMGMYTPVMGAYPSAMMGIGGMAPAAPYCPRPALPIAIVGDVCKADKWEEFTDDDGNKYYFNEKKDETTWDKPEDFDKQQNADKPAPPTEKPKKKEKYATDRKGWL